MLVGENSNAKRCKTPTGVGHAGQWPLNVMFPSMIEKRSPFFMSLRANVSGWRCFLRCSRVGGWVDVSAINYGILWKSVFGPPPDHWWHFSPPAPSKLTNSNLRWWTISWKWILEMFSYLIADTLEVMKGPSDSEIPWKFLSSSLKDMKNGSCTSKSGHRSTSLGVSWRIFIPNALFSIVLLLLGYRGLITSPQDHYFI